MSPEMQPERLEHARIEPPPIARAATPGWIRFLVAGLDDSAGGDPAPSIAISVHPISAEGIPALIPLAECDNKIIRNGIRAMLAECQEQAESKAAKNEKPGWTAHQITEKRMLEQLRAASAHWEQYTEDRFKRRSALKKFNEYAYQWY